MRKVFALVLILFMLFAVVTGYADDLDIQAVGAGAGPKPVEPMRFDDVTFGKTYKIDGYAAVNLLGFKFVNMFAQWEDGQAGENQQRTGILTDPTQDKVYSKKPKDSDLNYYYTNSAFKTSGNEAEFAWLKVVIQNLQKMPANFMGDISIKVIYDDEYEYNGWVRQFNYDYSKSEIYRYKEATPIGWPVCLSPVDEMSISPMYKGHYALGCTLPNFIVEDKKSPLRMVIHLGEHELTYNIRK